MKRPPPRMVAQSSRRKKATVDEFIRVNDQFYVLATSPMIDDRTRVLKQGETFGIFDRHGDILSIPRTEQGLYEGGTRFLAHFELSLGHDRPVLLSSTLSADNILFTTDLTNPDMCLNGTIVVPRGTLHFLRTKFLWKQACYERLCISNYGLTALDATFSLRFGADYTDIFEVRGQKRASKGRFLEEKIESGRLILAYEGLDGVTRRTLIECNPLPRETSSSQMEFTVKLKPKEQTSYYLSITCANMGSFVPGPFYDEAFHEATKAVTAGESGDCTIKTSNKQFNEWLDRSFHDIHMMVTETPVGLYPYAGLPWFSAPFGRDGIITALEYLWVNPDVARGVLAFLASTQAVQVIPEQDAEPGKILHESRTGEMAALKEIPYGSYYGSVDATPLFVVLAGAYHQRTGDTRFIEQLWPHITLALEWIDSWGDRDGDGFVEYVRNSPNGLVNQGWKDSCNAVFHADGTPAEGPIALCEVQGYVYEAKQRAADLAVLLGKADIAARLSRQAQELKERFEQAFWCDDVATYALALDGKKRQCRVRTSNAGHCLFSGIASHKHAQAVADSLLGNEFFSGWGVRTVASSETRYNPMSYHNGSVWPHDNAIIAMGLARYGFKESVLTMLTGLYEASQHMDFHRLPELFCGFDRQPGGSPTLYPVSCTPQAWSSASVFLLLQACLGMNIHASESRIEFVTPILPEYLREVRINNLRIGRASVNLSLHRHTHDVGIDVVDKEGELDVVVRK